MEGDQEPDTRRGRGISSPPQFGHTEVMGIPVRLSRTPGGVRMPAPELGQHTEEVLLELLGYDWDRIAELRDKQVI